MQAPTPGTQIAADKGWIGLGQEERARLNRVTYDILGAAFDVQHSLGSGFLEKVYENALSLELRSRDRLVDQQVGIDVRYRGEVVGTYYADLLVEDSVIVELKSSAGLDHSHYLQCVHYLAATDHRVCLLLNFGRSRLEYRRIVRGF